MSACVAVSLSVCVSICLSVCLSPGHDALWFATKNKHRDVVKVLQRRGLHQPSIEVTSKNNRTALLALHSMSLSFSLALSVCMTVSVYNPSDVTDAELVNKLRFNSDVTLPWAWIFFINGGILNCSQGDRRRWQKQKQNRANSFNVLLKYLVWRSKKA